MKKLFSYATIAFFVLATTSCTTEAIDPNLNSSEDGGENGGGNNGGNTTENVFLQREVVTDQSGAVVTYFYTYDDNKLLKITGSDGSLDEYSYEGDRVTQRIYRDNEDSYQKENYYYNMQGKLIRYTGLLIYTDGVTETQGYKNEYTYNTDGTITVKSYNGDGVSQTNLYDTATLTFNAGNLVSYEGTAYDATATFDAKNSPFKNIAGYETFILSDLEGGVNNELLYRYDDGHEVQTATSTYTYNSNNYPATSTLTLSTEESYSSQYFY